MSETIKTEWKTGNLELNKLETAEILAKLNEINRKYGRPEYRLRAKEANMAMVKERERGKIREAWRDKERAKKRIFGDDMHEILTEEEYDMEDRRANDVQKIMAGEDVVTREPAKEPAETIEPVAEAEEIEEVVEEEEPKNPDALVAVGIDWNNREEKLAKKLAREDLEAELKKDGFIKRIWKGNLFRNLYEDMYMYDYLDGDRTDEEGRTLSEIIDSQKEGLADEIISDVTEQVREYNKKDWDKRLVPVDKETNEKLKSTVGDYARFMFEASELMPDMAKDPDFIKEVDARFNKHMSGIIKKAQEEGKITGNIENNNYLDVAKEAARRYEEAVRNAKDKVEQDAAMAKVMAGFQAYNIETKRAFSRIHAENVEKIMDKFDPNELGQFVSPDAFFNAVDKIDEEVEEESEAEIKKGRELLGGDAGIAVMLDESPITPQSVARWNAWWEGLSHDGKEYARNLIRQVNENPDLYDLKWGDGFRDWLTVINSQELLAA